MTIDVSHHLLIGIDQYSWEEKKGGGKTQYPIKIIIIIIIIFFSNKVESFKTSSLYMSQENNVDSWAELKIEQTM